MVIRFAEKSNCLFWGVGERVQQIPAPRRSTEIVSFLRNQTEDSLDCEDQHKRHVEILPKPQVCSPRLLVHSTCILTRSELYPNFWQASRDSFTAVFQNVCVSWLSLVPWPWYLKNMRHRCSQGPENNRLHAESNYIYAESKYLAAIIVENSSSIPITIEFTTMTNAKKRSYRKRECSSGIASLLVTRIH